VGNGTAGYASNVQGAALNYPYDVVFDTLGNLLIVDDHNYALRKVESNGSIITIAGNHTQGYNGDGGVPTSFELGKTHSATVDCQGNIYLADKGNGVIHKIDTSGHSSIIVNANQIQNCTGDGGLAVNATLMYPDAMVADCNGNLYIVDEGCSTVRKVNSTGYISAFAGIPKQSGYSGDGGPATNATLNNAFGIALDTSGIFYVSDKYNNVIRKINTSGYISTVAGNYSLGAGYSGDGGLAINAQLNSPFGIVINTVGDLYIADEGNNVIRRINSSGYISTVAGNSTFGYSGDGGLAIDATLSNPKGIAFDSFGNLFIADNKNNVVRKVYL
jgi:secreted PhoX family phosphatase